MKKNYATRSDNNMLTVFDYAKIIELGANTVLSKENVISKKQSEKTLQSKIKTKYHNKQMKK